MRIQRYNEPDTIDVCRTCVSKLVTHDTRNNWETGIDHPEYDGEDYHCEECLVPLNNKDN